MRLENWWEAFVVSQKLLFMDRATLPQNTHSEGTIFLNTNKPSMPSGKKNCPMIDPIVFSCMLDQWIQKLKYAYPLAYTRGLSGVQQGFN